MDAINLDILKQLQEYAQMYFNAIVEANTTCGKCKFADGQYTAKDVTKWNYRQPEDDLYNEDVTLQSGTFKCKFPYRRIFEVLNDWETMSRAGKLKTVFEIGETETKSAKVLIQEKTALGAFKFKTMKLQRIAGNWWGLPKEISKGDCITGYYELNEIAFIPGKTFMGEVDDERNQKFADEWNDTKIIESMIGFIASRPEQSNAEYYKTVLDMAGIDTETDEAKAIAKAAIEKRREEDEKQARELAERNAREEETRSKRLEQEERMKRDAVERLEKSKEKFISGKMISREEFEDITESIGYEINIRTLGTLRKRVTWIEVDNEGTPTVYGTKTRRGLDGTFEMIREIWTRLKELMPEPVKHISEIIETCRLHDDNGEETDEYKYYKWLTNAHCGHYRTIAENTLVEVLAGIFEAAYRKGHGHITAMNKDGILIETIIIAIRPPQSPEIPETVYHTTGPEKCATEPRIKPRRTVRVLLAYPQKRVALNLPQGMNFYTVNHIRGTTKMIYAPPGYSPPIRGDCTMRINSHITYFKPP